LPKSGHRFKLRQLPPHSRMLYRRLAEIYGVDVNKILPIYKKYYKDIYIGRDHSIRGGSFKLRSNLDHEALHSIDRLIEYSRNTSPYSAERNKFYHRLLSSRLVKILLTYVPGTLDWKYRRGSEARANIPKSLGQRIRDYPIRFTLPLDKVYREIYKRHGPDGLLLVYATTDPESKAKEVKECLKANIKEGVIKRNGGLTEKGEKEFREEIIKELLIKNAQEGVTWPFKEIEAEKKKQKRKK